MKIFSGSSNKPLAKEIARNVNLELSPLEIFVFPDGERRIRVEEDVLGQDCVVVQSTCPPVDRNYMELFFIIDALKRSGAKSITAVIPYFGYQRQDHVFRSGEVRSLEVVVRFLETIGATKVLGVDFHSSKVPELFKISTVALSALPLFATKIKENGWLTNDTFLVSPDMGGLRRIKQISEMLQGMPYIATIKNRDLATGNIEISEIEGDKNIISKRALIVDDMISSGKTIVQSSELLLKQGVEEVYVFVTHPIFSKEAPELLGNSKIKKVFVTDSVHVVPEKRFDQLEILSVADIIAKEIIV